MATKIGGRLTALVLLRGTKVKIPRTVWLILLCLLLAVAFESVVPAAVLAGEAGSAKESGGNGFDLGMAIEIVGAIVVPTLTFGAGFVTDRKLQKREYNREQLAFANEFLASSGSVLGRLESFATGTDHADDVAPLQRELRGVSEASTKITDAEIKRLGQRFFDSTVAVLRAVASPDVSTQPVARDAVQAFDDLRSGVEQFRCELSPKRKRARETEVSTATRQENPKKDLDVTM